MEHDERYYVMMMDALDGELADEVRHDLEAHLRACPDCQREWNALSAIDTLFRHTPMLQPAADFAARTIARLPDHRLRARALAAAYALLMIGGLIPLALAGFVLIRYLPIFQQPALLEHVWTSLVDMGQVFATVVSALLAAAGRYLVEQPTLIGWMVVLVGFVLVWGGVLQQYVLQPKTAYSRN